jgi:DNA-binding GntR family transcriptional regulator
MDDADLDHRGIPNATGRKQLSRATLASQLEDAIRLDIIEGILPPGKRLRAVDLTERYGVSATPLREALQRLAGQSLIDLDPRLGATVADISQTDLHDVYWLRDILESLALERSMERGDEEWQSNLSAAWDKFHAQSFRDKGHSREAALDWSAAHNAFHSALFAACGSTWLLRFLDILADHSERYRMLSARTRARPSLDEHEEIFRAAMVRDSITAVAALRRHLAATVALLESTVQDR